MFDDSASSLTTFELPEIENYVDKDGKIDGKHVCFVNGTATYSGQVNESGEGVAIAKFTNCVYYSGHEVSGTITVKVSQGDAGKVQMGVYVDDFEISYNESSEKLTGSIRMIAESGTVSVNQNLLIEDQSGSQVLSQLKFEELGYSSSTVAGAIKIGDAGAIYVSTSGLRGDSPQFYDGEIKFSGLENSATIEFSSDQTAYYVDSDLDGQYDLGAYISNMHKFMAGQVVNINPVAIDLMSLPPIVYSPYYYDQMPDTTTPITVETGDYYDMDTPAEELQVSFAWYLNDELVADQITNTLPAGIAVYGDTLEVAMRVSDSANTVLSNRIAIELADAPSYIEVTELPDSISPNQRIEFTVTTIDPDKTHSPKLGTLLSGPSGAVVGEDGKVTWTAPAETLFSSQEYFFNFATGNEQNPEESSVSVTVNTTKPLPIARSGIDVPKREGNIVIGDFDGDRKNEILTTDNQYRVTLLTNENGKQEQKWLYPYSLPTEGTIQQLFAANIDNDAEKEIYVLTTKGLSIIDGLNAPARELISFEDDILSGALKDIDNDGLPELAVILNHNSFYYSHNMLNVYNLDTPHYSLFTAYVGDANSIVIANVDEDPNLELVVNTGLVYDMVSWEKQWLSGNTFGQHLLTTADLNGDGIEEIVGYNNEIVVYSAVDKSQLTTLEGNDLCSITAGNIDDDANDELILGECQWGDIHAYNFKSDKSFENIWTANKVDHSLSSLQLGDSDNDGKPELLWGTGITHSGADMLVTADIDAGGVTVRSDQIAPQLDMFAPAGWAKTNETTESAIFFLPRTNSGYDGSRVAHMSKEGDLTLSDVISSNWSGHKASTTADFNNDGLTELLVPNNEIYTTGLGIMELATHTITYQLPVDSNEQLITVDAADVNGDNVKDALFGTSNSVKLVDTYNQSMVASYNVSSSLRDFTTHLNGSLSMVVASNNLSLLQLANGALSEKSTIEQICNQVEYFNYDSDAALEIVCLSNTDSYYSDVQSEIYVFEVNNEQLEQVHHKALAENVVHLAVSPTEDNNQGLILVTQAGYSYRNEDPYAHVVFTDSKGYKISRSPKLPGTSNQDGLKVRLDDNGKLNVLLTTSNGMYQIH
ncbi:hypothetical protein [Pseudoalteromonas luteoviolacea]|uniref:Uncharacterized protein n=1 Tax=Pseudoalteromonas luteoviolacea DSM 6061 TaxID=1365250 RepID=A0A166WWK7_9GAMM|nr:hypothetical protein [Pseudoalteromonas luteoviolacea]KZN38160.1 hypothetical protein N475_16145 [Pseudoalteromonas luteoviolacea DSM 6061]MBE0388811.1 hypothetical protein [Pseudoalteromonas luteoviolacea DSM 6061]